MSGLCGWRLCKAGALGECVCISSAIPALSRSLDTQGQDGHSTVHA